MFKINQVCYDSENKEYVKISKGIEKDGVLTPTEVIALRVVAGSNATQNFLIAFTYRKVNPRSLSVCDGDTQNMFDVPEKGEFKYIGRVYYLKAISPNNHEY